MNRRKLTIVFLSSTLLLGSMQNLVWARSGIAKVELGTASDAAIKNHVDIDPVAHELKRKNYDKAADYLVVRLEADAKNEPARMMPHPGSRKAQLCLQAFEDGGRLDLSERVLKKAIQLEQGKPTDSKTVPWLNNALLAEVYAKEKKNNDALIAANQVLKGFDANPDHLLRGQLCSPTISVLFWAVDAFMKNGDAASAELLNSSILAFFQRHIGSKNEGYVQLLDCTATIYGARGDKENQEKSLSEALKIASWNWGAHSPKTPDLRMKYAAVLRELGRKEEADRIEAFKSAFVKSPDMESLYGPAYGWSSSPPPDSYADTAEEPLLDWLSRSVAGNGEADAETIRIIDSLIVFNLDRGRYDRAEGFAKQKLQIWKDIEGVCSDQKCLCMIELAEISLRRRDKATAIEWLKKAEQANAFDKSHNRIKLACCWLKVGDLDSVTRLILKPAKSFEDPATVWIGNELFAECAYLLTEIGQDEQVEKLTKIYNDKLAAIKNQNAIFGHHGYDWNKKRSDIVYRLKNGVWIRTTVGAEQDAASGRLIRGQRYRTNLEKAEEERKAKLRAGLPPELLITVEESERRAREEYEYERMRQARISDPEERAKASAASEKRRMEASEKAEKLVEDLREQRKQEIEAQFQISTARFEKVKNLKAINPGDYIGGLCLLADGYQQKELKEKAQELRLQALNVYLEADPKKMRKDSIAMPLRVLDSCREHGMMSEDAIVSYFRKLAEYTEVNWPNETKNQESLQSFITGSLKGLDRTSNIRLYQAWIDARKKVRGERDASLDELLTIVASLYQASSNNAKTKEYLIERRKLNVKSAAQKIKSELSLADFYASTNQPLEAEKCWRAAGQAENWILGSLSIEAYLNTADQFRKKDLIAQAQEMTDLAISNPTDDNIHVIDLVLKERVYNLVAQQSPEKAEQIVVKRLADGKKLREPDKDNFWQTTLSDLEKFKGGSK